MDTTTKTLAAMRPGDRCIIESVDTADDQVLRLMVLGLVEGAVVEAAGTAIGGDPLEVRLFGCALSLRREHARYFHVSPLAGSSAPV